eukprot:m.433034 g.433034  ORF g.433034 m.433034 type:complete len:1131 (-) comp20247_c1_seq19:62-3454(-)
MLAGIGCSCSWQECAWSLAGLRWSSRRSWLQCTSATFFTTTIVMCVVCGVKTTRRSKWTRTTAHSFVFVLKRLVTAMATATTTTTKQRNFLSLTTMPARQEATHPQTPLHPPRNLWLVITTWPAGQDPVRKTCLPNVLFFCLVFIRVRKSFPGTLAPKYTRLSGPGYHFKVVVAGSKPKTEVCCDEPTDNARQGQHLAATMCLYTLAKHQGMHLRLPPPYRAWWLAKAAEEQAAADAARSEALRPRRELILALLQRLQARAVGAAAGNGDCVPAESRTGESEEDGSQSSLSSSSAMSQSLGPKRASTEADRRLRADFQARQQTRPWQDMAKQRKALPADGFRDHITRTVEKHQVVIVSGETGCGKTTQVPQFILEASLRSPDGTPVTNVLCTEPRRISAMSIAQRVCQELGDARGPGVRGSLCGYQVRMENKQTKDTRLLYCTTGIVLRRLQGDPMLKDVNVIVVDEVHERSVQSDFLLILLRRLLTKRHDLRCVLMSATVDAERLARYFGQAPIITIPGRTFPVEKYFLEDVVDITGYVLEQDSPYALRTEHELTGVTVTGRGGKQYTHVAEAYVTEEEVPHSGLEGYTHAVRSTVSRMDETRINFDIIEELLLTIDTSPTYAGIEGSVLVFMPGFAEIQTLYTQLMSNKTFYDESKWCVVPLHSVLGSQDQKKAFDTPPQGVRKVVIATNIAETGITIPDVVFVIDSGKMKETRYREASRMSCLVETYVSRASAEQRCGRAGRVREGVCFRLFTKSRHSKFREFAIPEIQRVPLEELCLHILSTELGHPVSVFAEALDPPNASAVTSALRTLYEVGALAAFDESDGVGEHLTLTPLGKHLAALPVDVHLGRMMVFASLFGCVDPILTVAAALSHKSPFFVPFSKRTQADQARFGFALAGSDLLTIYKAVCEWRKAKARSKAAAKEFCRQNFLSSNALEALERLVQDFHRLLTSLGFAGTPLEDNRNANDTSIVRSVIAAGLYPQIAGYNVPRTLTSDPPPVSLKGGATARPHPSSLLHHTRWKPSDPQWMAYATRIKTSQVYLRDCTAVPPQSLLLFGGDIAVDHRAKTVTVDGWIRLQATARTAVLFRELREELQRVLALRLADASIEFSSHPVVACAVRLLGGKKR